MNLKLNHIQHIGIPVRDIKVSEAFYEKLGFKNIMPATFEINGEKGGLVAMMAYDDMIIELYQLPASHLPEIKTRKDGHIDHVAFDVDNIQETFELLQKNGFMIVEPEPVFLQFWNKGCYYFIILGPDGERLEFNQIVK